VPTSGTGALRRLALTLGLALGGCEGEMAKAPAAVAELDVIVEATPDEGTAPLEVRFAAQVRDGVAPWSHHWEFGDGDSGGGSGPVHVYAVAGRYVVRLTVTDGGGQRGTDEVEVIVDGVE